MKWLGITLLTIGLGLLSIYLPWYITLTAFSLFCLIIFSHIRFQWVAYAIVFLALQIGSKGPFISSEILLQKFEVLPLFLIFTSIAALIFMFRKFARIDITDSRKNPLYVPILLLVFYSILSIFWSPASNFVNIFHNIFLILNIIVFFLVFQIVDNEELHRKLMWCLIFSGILLSLQIIFSPLLLLGNYQIKIFGDIYLDLSTPITLGSRARGVYMNSIISSILVSFLVMVAYGLLLNEANRTRKSFLFFVICLFLLALFLTRSRVGAWALVCMILLFIFLNLNVKRKFFRTTLIISFLTLIVFLVSEGVVAKYIFPQTGKVVRIVNVDVSSEGGSIGSRLYYWKKGFEALDKRSLTLVGLGAGGYNYCNPDIPTPHNLYLSLFFDFGIMAVIFIFSIIFTSIRAFNNILRHQKTYLQNMSLVFGTMLFGLSLMSLVFLAYEFTFIWFFLGLIYATSSLAQQELKEKQISQNYIGTNTNALSKLT